VETYPDLLIDEKNKKTIGKIISSAKDKEFLNLFDSLTVLEKIGVPVSPLYRVYTEQELKISAKEHGFPLTMKIASDDVTHKTEVRGVVPNIPTLSQLVKEFQTMTRNPAAKTRGVFVQPQAHGYEVFIGAKRDATFGVVLIFGLGGIYAELFKDVATRVYPFSQREFIRMAKETKMFKLLSGFRGSPPIDLGLLYDIMYRICYLMVEFPMIKELDVNPLFVSANGVSVVDARIIL
jgi:acyl-CoA synthetase (NDP forming)